MANPEYKLTYFNVKARGESIRLMLVYLGVDFEDIRVPCWPKTGEVLKQWHELKSSTEFRVLPVLELKDGRKLSCTMPILRYLGKKHGLYGNNDWEEAKLEAVTDIVADIVTDLYDITDHVLDKGTMQQRLERLAGLLIAPRLPAIEHMLIESKSGCFGSKLSWADFFMYNNLHEGFEKFIGISLESYPHIKKFIHHMSAIPAIAEWNEKNKDVLFDFYKCLN